MGRGDDASVVVLDDSDSDEDVAVVGPGNTDTTRESKSSVPPKSNANANTNANANVNTSTSLTPRRTGTRRSIRHSKPTSKTKPKPNSTSRYIHHRVAKKFDSEIYFGTIMEFDGKYWKVEYDDGDREDLNEDEVLEGISRWKGSKENVARRSKSSGRSNGSGSSSSSRRRDQEENCDDNNNDKGDNSFYNNRLPKVVSVPRTQTRTRAHHDNAIGKCKSPSPQKEQSPEFEEEWSSHSDHDGEAKITPTSDVNVNDRTSTGKRSRDRSRSRRARTKCDRYTPPEEETKSRPRNKGSRYCTPDDEEPRPHPHPRLQLEKKHDLQTSEEEEEEEEYRPPRKKAGRGRGRGRRNTYSFPYKDAIVAKRFDSILYKGTITGCFEDLSRQAKAKAKAKAKTNTEGDGKQQHADLHRRWLWHVSFDDGDQEDWDLAELLDGLNEIHPYHGRGKKKKGRDANVASNPHAFDTAEGLHYEVDKILDRRVKSKKSGAQVAEYRVSWKGYDYMSWVLAEQLDPNSMAEVRVGLKR